MPASPYTEITKRYEFEAAHWLPYHDGKCRKLHGHTWVLEITVRGWVHAVDPNNPQSGMVMDFYRLKEIITRVDPDHRCLNSHGRVPDRWPQAVPYPTSENLARRFFELIEGALSKDVYLVKVTLWETRTGGATVWNEAEQRVLPQPD